MEHVSRYDILHCVSIPLFHRPCVFQHEIFARNHASISSSQVTAVLVKLTLNHKWLILVYYQTHTIPISFLIVGNDTSFL